ncbi:hypothetical protein ACHAXH_004091 [Discostella pseudostelligera]|jgi:ubiquitin-protein ligase
MAASTKRLLKERTNIARNPIPYVTFADDDNDDDNDDQNDTKMADASSSSDNISQWRFILTLDPIHDSLEESSEIGKAADSPYCCAPSSTSPSNSAASSTTGKSKGAAGLLAGVTRAAASRASKKSSSSNDTCTTTASSSTSSTSSSTSEAAYFAFQLDFPATYPFKPPQITVLSPSYHPNIKKSSGEICDAILTGDGWGPTLNIRKICARLRKFLCEPDVQHPLETELGQLLSEKPGEYKVEAYKFARENALDRGKMVEEFLRKGSGGSKK